ncbi:MAG: Na/Pi cotransporter family protein [Christensenellaceae bacterium]
MLFVDLMMLLGGIAVFLLGLNFISDSADSLAESKASVFIAKSTKNRLLATMTGGVFSAVAQSSVAVNVLSLSFVERGVISLLCCCALVIGTNFGTTMTAQVVSLKYVASFNVTAFGAVFAFIGFLLNNSGNAKVKNFSGFLLGFGLIFIGIEFMCSLAENLKNYYLIQCLFTVKSRPILLLNGFFVTALCQSSSVVTSILVIFAGENLLDFSDAVFLIMGANIGTCIPVIIASHKRSGSSQVVAYFNLVFNILGVAVFYTVISIFPDFIKRVFNGFGSAKAIADFHSFFNLSLGVVALIFLNPLVKLSARLSRLMSGYKPINSSKKAELKANDAKS